MKIACLGWGSLVWNPGSLPIHRYWYSDGPFLPIEFARQSKDGRITLVLLQKENYVYVRSLWALMSLDTLHEARKALQERENIKEENIEKHIGACLLQENPKFEIEKNICRWGRNLGLDAVIWTNLPPKFNEKDTTPSSEEVVNYLLSLRGSKRDLAEEYVRRTPQQIDTPTRQLIKAKLNWLPLSK